MNDLLVKIRTAAVPLDEALKANAAAATRRHQAWQAWNTETLHTEASSKACASAEARYDTTRDAVMAASQPVLTLVEELARLSPPAAYQQLLQQAASLRDALTREAAACAAYSKVSGTGMFALRALDRWTTAREFCAQAAFYLGFYAARIPFLLESQIPTDLDDDTTQTAEWPAARPTS